MARKPKTGLEYYSVDTNIFQNRKIKRLIRTFGAKGYMIYSYLITEIYRDKGCFLEWDENTAFDVSDYLNESENLVEEVVGYCCNVGLFNKELRTSENVLTTKNIQEFWVKVSKQAKRKFCDVDVRYSLIKEESTVNKEESTLNREFKTVKREESTQSKVKESKVDDKVKNINALFSDFKKEIKDGAHAEAIEQMYMRLKLKKGSLTPLIKEFNGRLIIENKLHPNTLEFRKHFDNWLNTLDRNGKLNQYKTKAIGAL